MADFPQLPTGPPPSEQSPRKQMASDGRTGAANRVPRAMGDGQVINASAQASQAGVRVERKEYERKEYESWLADPSLCDRLLDFSKTIFTSENIEFVMAERTYRKKFDVTQESKMRHSALDLYKKYCADSSESQIYLESEQMERLTQSVHGSAPMTEDMFADGRHLALKTVEREIFPQFKAAEAAKIIQSVTRAKAARKLMEALHAPKAATTAERITNLFARFDLNSNGAIDLAELKAFIGDGDVATTIINQLGEHNKAQREKDGMITMQDFIKYFQMIGTKGINLHGKRIFEEEATEMILGRMETLAWELKPTALDDIASRRRSSVGQYARANLKVLVCVDGSEGAHFGFLAAARMLQKSDCMTVLHVSDQSKDDLPANYKLEAIKTRYSAAMAGLLPNERCKLWLEEKGTRIGADLYGLYNCKY
jgi:Ca2+-binding EF-hand superfamily protein